MRTNVRTMGVQVADTLAWLSDELRSECSQPVLQRARGIANQWRSKMEDLHCLTASPCMPPYGAPPHPPAVTKCKPRLISPTSCFWHATAPARHSAVRSAATVPTGPSTTTTVRNTAASTMTTTTITSTTTTISAPAARTATSTMMTTRLPPPAAGTPACAST